MNNLHTISSLPNGTRLASVHMPHMHSVGIGVMVHAGSRFEQASESGISHFLEHLLFKGTKNRSVTDIKEEIEGIGGILNAYTSEEVTCYFVKVLSRHFNKSLEVLLDMHSNPLLRATDISKERQVIGEEIKMYADLPQHFVYDRITALLWPRHSLGRNVAGSLESIQAINRQDIVRYHRSAYTTQRTLVAVCGGVAHSVLERQVGRWQRRFRVRTSPESSCPVNVAPSEQMSPRREITCRAIEQINFCLGIHAVSRQHPLSYALELLHVILGANMSSRLFNEVRERKGLAYEISTSVRCFHDCGALVVHAGVHSGKVEQALALTLRELRNLSRRPVGETELRRAREYSIGQLLLNLEDTAEHMSWLSERVLNGQSGIGLDALIRRIKAVRPRDILNLSRMMFHPSRLNCAMIGPVSDRQQQAIARILDNWE